MDCTLREQILKFDRAVPRYTSYPPAPHFKPLGDARLYHGWLAALPSDMALSLYIHVPFCTQLCWYCGCNTTVTKTYTPIENYVRLLMRELSLLAASLPAGMSVGHIHFGGGSPGLLSPTDFDALMNAIRTEFNVLPDAEIAIELDPRGISEGRVATYARQGVNRVSLGVQDFDDKVMSGVNRRQPFFLSYDAMRLLRAYGIGHINFDLIYGLPHQSVQIMRETVQKALLLRPERIALFGYAHVPWMKKHMQLLEEAALPDKALRFDLFTAGAKALAQAGYEAIGIDHFALPDDPLCAAARAGRLHRNFQGYTTDPCDALIGIGASAIGRLPGGYVQNMTDMPAYRHAVGGGDLPVRKYYPLLMSDRVDAAVIEGLMCHMRVDLAAIRRLFQLSPAYFAAALDKLQPYCQAGFAAIDGDVITINPDARPAARLVASVFDRYHTADPEKPQHARAV